MENCPICGREISSKRKDAKYCRNPTCRKKAHETRKAQAAQLPPSLPEHKASVVIAFPDGSRWLMELTPLQATPPSQFPTLTQVDRTTPQISSGSVPVPAAVPTAAVVAPGHSNELARISSDQIPTAVSGSSSALPDPLALAALPPAAPSPPEAPSTPPQEISKSAGGTATPELRTVELYFTDDTGRRLPFRDAMHRRPGGGWRLSRYARPSLGFGRYEGHGLGGGQGRWREFYAQRSPEDFGFDRDLAVLCADDEAGRAYAPDMDLLTEVLGKAWKEQLREFVRGRLAGRSR